MKTWIYLLALLCLCVACEVDSFLNDSNSTYHEWEQEEETQFCYEIIWEKSFPEDDLHIIPFEFEEKVLLRTSGSGLYNSKLIMYNWSIGEILWTWESPEEYSIDENNYDIDQEYFAFSDRQDLFVVELATGSLLWKSEIRDTSKCGNTWGSRRISIIGDYIYQVHSQGYRSEYDHLARAKVGNWQWDTIYSEPMLGEQYPEVVAPEVWQVENSSKGDHNEDVLIFQTSFSGHMVTLRAFDLSSRELLWKTDSLCRHRELDGLQIKGDALYLRANKAWLKLDARTGEVLWSYHSVGLEHSNQSNFVLVDETTVLQTNNSFVALNDETGQQKWKYEDYQIDRRKRVDYHDGRIIFIGERINSMNIDTGEFICIGIVEGVKDFAPEFMIEDETGYIFAMGGRKLMYLKAL